MRIAVVSDDGASVSSHFGRARTYVVLDVEDGAITRREQRAKPAPHWDAQEGAAVHSLREARQHGTDAASRAKHDRMAASIHDCECVLAGGMGAGAQRHLAASGLRVILTDLQGVDEAALACAAGAIVDHPELAH